MAMVDHEDGIITTVLYQTLGRKMIDVGQATDVGDRIHGIIQRLMSPPHNEAQPSQEMLVLRDFQNNQQGTLTDIDVHNNANREL